MSANALCDEKIINELRNNGDYEIHCLAYRCNGQPKEEIINDIHIHRFPKSLWWNILVWAKRNDNLGASIIRAVEKIRLRINQIILAPFYPVLTPFANRKFARKAICYNAKEHYDIVVAEHHGQDCLYAGYCLKRKEPKIQSMAILWDPIATKLPPRYLPQKFSVRRLLNYELTMSKVYDCVVAMYSSEALLREKLRGNINLKKYLFLDIPGIVRPIRYENKCKYIKNNMINIVFSGILSLPDRNPEKIIKALNGVTVAKKINCVFFCTGDGIEKLEKLKDSFSGNIDIHGYISHEELGKVYTCADILLNFGGSNPNMVPSKIFDYMSYCKRILSVYHIDNDSSLYYLKKYPAAICVDERKTESEMISQLEQFLCNVSDPLLSYEDVIKTFVNNTPKAFVEAIYSFDKSNGN